MLASHNVRLVAAWCITPKQGGRVGFQGEHQARRMKDAIRSKNVAIGEYSFKLKNGQTKTVKYISIAGKELPNPFINEGITHIDGYKIIEHNTTDWNNLISRKWVDEEIRAFDAEAKIVEKIAQDIKTEHGIDIIAQGKSIEDFKVKLNVTSEMKPCTSCGAIFDRMLSGFSPFKDIKGVYVRYGTDFP